MKRQKKLLPCGIGESTLTVILFIAISLSLFAEAEKKARPDSRSREKIQTLLVVSKGAKADRKAAGHFRDWSRDFNVQFVALQIQDVDESIDVELYDGAIVLSTQEERGRDPELLAFVKHYRRNFPIVFVGLIPNSKSTEYTIATASELGVDIVTAATKWGGKTLKEMHRKWFYDTLIVLSQ